MWLVYAFFSAALLGCYDSFKKASLRGNAVIPVLFLNTLFSSLLLAPLLWMSAHGEWLDGTPFHAAPGGWEQHRLILLKSCIVLSSWICGYFAMKHLPLTIVGPVNATRPVMVLVGAMLLFGERLNLYQWIGVLLAVAAFFMLGRSSRKEGIDFRRDRWVWCLVAAALLGACSGLYDRYLMAPVSSGGAGLDRMMVLGWYNIYQCGMMAVVLLVLWWPRRHQGSPFRWHWAIPLISIFLVSADFLYMYALTFDDAMISIVSMIRRGSVVVSFLFGALVFHEKNLRSKAFDLLLVLLGMVFLWLGSR